MKIRYLKNSRPVRPWVRAWMVWAVGLVAIFLPALLGGIISAPFWIARDAWEDTRDEVQSYKLKR